MRGSSSSASAPYRADARGGSRRRGTLFTGPLEHRHLVHLLPLADVDGRAVDLPGGVRDGRRRGRSRRLPPLVARHSGLAEVAAGLEAVVPGALRAAWRRSRRGDAATSRRSSSGSSRSRAQSTTSSAARCAAVVDRWSSGSSVADAVCCSPCLTRVASSVRARRDCACTPFADRRPPSSRPARCRVDSCLTRVRRARG